MKITHKALLVALVSIASLLGFSLLLVNLLDKFPLATISVLLTFCMFLFGRSVYLKELDKLKAEAEEDEVKD